MDQESREGLAVPTEPEAVFRRCLTDYMATAPHLYKEEKAILPVFVDSAAYSSSRFGPGVKLAREGRLMRRKELADRPGSGSSSDERAKSPALRAMKVFPGESLLSFLGEAFRRERGVDLAVVGGAPVRWAVLDARFRLGEEDVVAYLSHPFRTAARGDPWISVLSDVDVQLFGSGSGRFFEDRETLENFLGGKVKRRPGLSGLQIRGWESGWRKGLVYAEGCFQSAPVERKMGREPTQVLHVLPSRAGSVYGSVVAGWAGPLHYSACETTLRSPFVVPLYEWKEKTGERGNYLVVDLFGAIEMAQKGISLCDEAGKFIELGLPINIPIPELFFLPGGDSFMATLDLMSRLAVDKRNSRSRACLWEKRGRSSKARAEALTSYLDYPSFDVEGAERQIDQALGLFEFGKGVLVSKRGGRVRMVKDRLPSEVAAEFSKLVAGVASIKSHLAEVVADLPEENQVKFREMVAIRLTKTVLTGNPQVLFCLLAPPEVVLPKELVQGTGLGELFPKLRSKITPELLAKLAYDQFGDSVYSYRGVDQEALCRLFEVGSLKELFELEI